MPTGQQLTQKKGRPARKKRVNALLTLHPGYRILALFVHHSAFSRLVGSKALKIGKPATACTLRGDVPIKGGCLGLHPALYSTTRSAVAQPRRTDRDRIY